MYSGQLSLMFKCPKWLSACALCNQECQGHAGGEFTTLCIIKFIYHLFRTELSNVLQSCVLVSMYPKVPGKNNVTKSWVTLIYSILSAGGSQLFPGTGHELNRTNDYYGLMIKQWNVTWPDSVKISGSLKWLHTVTMR